MSRRRAAATLALAACGAAFAQTAVVPDGPRIPSLPEAAFERIDGALRDRVAAADTADAHFVRGLQATMDPGARIEAYAAAYRQRPGEFLFLSSLADACTVRAIPNWPDCAQLDPMSRWASRDADNAAPRVLLAERARARGDLTGPARAGGLRRQLAAFRFVPAARWRGRLDRAPGRRVGGARARDSVRRHRDRGCPRERRHRRGGRCVPPRRARRDA